MKKAMALCLALLLILGLAACGQSAQTEEKPAETQKTETAQAQPTESDDPPAPDFTLTDQFGKEHRLSDYKGKVVLLNFWATWCPYCIKEMPHLQKLYESEAEKKEPDLIVLGVAAPGQSGETDETGLADFLKEHGWSYPTLMDADGSVFRTYGASGLPVSFIINREGGVFGYVPGSLTEEILQKIVDQALGNGEEAKQ